MEKEFVNHNQAFRLKALGFDEPCFFAFDNCSTPMRCTDLRTNEQKFNGVNYNSSSYTSQPTFSQAFRWFREKYNLHAEITWSPSYEYDSGEWSDAIYEITITNVSYTKEWVAESPDMQRANGKQLTYEEAELACLDKLLEIVESHRE